MSSCGYHRHAMCLQNNLIHAEANLFKFETPIFNDSVPVSPIGAQHRGHRDNDA